MIAQLLNVLKDTELHTVNVNYIHMINKKTFNVSEGDGLAALR